MNSVEPSWDLYRSFLAVLDEGSLSSAARTLALTQPTLARHIEELEASRGDRVKSGPPTEAAHALAPHARTMASAAAALIRTASGAGDAIEGAVRLTASDVVGVEVLPAILRDLRAKHPKLSLEILASNQPADLLRREADIAIRMVQPTQSALVAKRVGDVMLGMHAHRDYIKRHGAPKSLDDVEGHALIGYDRETIAVQALRKFGLRLTREQFAFRTDNDLAQLNLIRSGAGIGICQIGLARRDKNLVRILPDDFSFPLGAWITMHEDLRGSARMRAVFDHLVEAMSAYARET